MSSDVTSYLLYASDPIHADLNRVHFRKARTALVTISRRVLIITFVNIAIICILSLELFLENHYHQGVYNESR